MKNSAQLLPCLSGFPLHRTMLKMADAWPSRAARIIGGVWLGLKAFARSPQPSSISSANKVRICMISYVVAVQSSQQRSISSAELKGRPMCHVSHSCDLMQNKVGDACTLSQPPPHRCAHSINLTLCTYARACTTSLPAVPAAASLDAHDL